MNNYNIRAKVSSGQEKQAGYDDAAEGLGQDVTDVGAVDFRQARIDEVGSGLHVSLRVAGTERDLDRFRMLSMDVLQSDEKFPIRK